MATIVLLVGAKGVGKTRIAGMLASVFGAHAVPVEPMWLARMRERPRPAGEAAVAWEREGFDEVAGAALVAARAHEIVVLDTTGTSEHTARFVECLARGGTLVRVRIRAELETCASRVRMRAAADQIPVSDERLAEINARALSASMSFEETIENDAAWDELAMRARWHRILVAHGVPARARVPTLRTERLVLRDWHDADLEPFAELNADPRVMEHFPKLLVRAESDDVAGRIRAELASRGAGLWAVEIPGIASFAGFAGLSVPSFEAAFLPAVEVGWRLAHPAWGHGYATEAARAAVCFGFDELGLSEIVSFTAPANLRSTRVMEKLGMRLDAGGAFDHPRVPLGHHLRPHVLYRLRAEELRT